MREYMPVALTPDDQVMLAYVTKMGTEESEGEDYGHAAPNNDDYPGEEEAHHQFSNPLPQEFSATQRKLGDYIIPRTLHDAMPEECPNFPLIDLKVSNYPTMAEQNRRVGLCKLALEEVEAIHH